MLPLDGAHDLRRRLDAIPRVLLGALPTPLQESPRLADLVGVRRVFVKRDDLTGLGLGGNKVRTLEYTVADALASDSNVLVGAAYVHSNHCRQLAAAGARLGIAVRLILNRRSDGTPHWQGNLLLDELFGAEVEFVAVPDVPALLAVAQRRIDELRAADLRPALVTLGPRSKLFGAVAAMRTLLEMTAQLEEVGERRFRIYVASGGPTYAGLIAAARIIGSDVEITGISNQFDRATHRAMLEALMPEMEALVGISVPDEAPHVDIDDRFVGPGGYGTPSDDALDAIGTAARTDGLILDPIYTGKGMAGLLARAREGRLGCDDVIVFHHTGGVPGVFSFAQQLHERLTGRAQVASPGV